jgi:hypothetical protein
VLTRDDDLAAVDDHHGRGVVAAPAEDQVVLQAVALDLQDAPKMICRSHEGYS